MKKQTFWVCPNLEAFLCQKLELEERRKAEEELRRLEQERKQQIYISLKEVQGSKHTREEEEDKEWQNTCKENQSIYTTNHFLNHLLKLKNCL